MKNIMDRFKQLPRKARILINVLLLTSIIFVSLSGYLYSRVRYLANPAKATEIEIKKIVADVGKLVVLPKDEIPSLATVSEPEKLKNQAFFANSEIGDKVLIYENSKKAILWRPSIKKIIEISSLNMSALQSQE
ncbi:MAG: hypothetical protein AB200_01580 [Parcubacteria bacterium C7867-005]|nr:MAG: hypothetical protein AB200_01580 [Parcubacteria bacterium C7867-005]